MLRFSRVRFLILLGLLLAVYLWHMRILDYDISRMRAYFIPRASTVLEQTELLFEPHNVALRVRRAGNGVREVPHTSLGCDSPAETLKQAKAEGHRPTHPACDQVWENPYANEEGWIMLHIELQRYQIFHREQLNCLKHELYLQWCQSLFSLGPEMQRQNSFWRCACTKISCRMRMRAYLAAGRCVRGAYAASAVLLYYNVRWLHGPQGCQTVHNCLLQRCLALQKQPLAPGNFHWRCF